MRKQTRSPRMALYGIWQHMLRRCTDPSAKGWKHYGGRGIRVCDRWQEFENFHADMAPRPEGMTLDRIDTNGNYEPTNCRWTDMPTQIRNRRYTINLTHNGETMCIADWARKLGMDYNTLQERIRRGWPVEKALTTPPSRMNAALRVNRIGNEVRHAWKTPAWGSVCSRGHVLTPENSRPTPGYRPECNICGRERQRQQWRNNPQRRQRQSELREQRRQQFRDSENSSHG